MPTHRALVKAYVGGLIVAPGDAVDYDGPPSWVYEPIDPVERARWAEEHADRGRVIDHNWKTSGRFGNSPAFDTLTPGGKGF